MKTVHIKEPGNFREKLSALELKLHFKAHNKLSDFLVRKLQSIAPRVIANTTKELGSILEGRALKDVSSRLQPSSLHEGDVVEIEFRPTKDGRKLFESVVLVVSFRSDSGNIFSKPYVRRKWTLYDPEKVLEISKKNVSGGGVSAPSIRLKDTIRVHDPSEKLPKSYRHPPIFSALSNVLGFSEHLESDIQKITVARVPSKEKIISGVISNLTQALIANRIRLVIGGGKSDFADSQPDTDAPDSSTLIEQPRPSQRVTNEIRARKSMPNPLERTPSGGSSAQRGANRR